MPVYTFRFGSQFVGQDAQVFDAATKVEVEGSPYTIEADGTGAVATATLDEGNYYADASNALLALGGSRTTGTLDIIASIAAGGGGSSETDGVGAVFFGGLDLAASFDNVPVYLEFQASDDPPRAPQRDDLMVIDSEDGTTINVVRSGLYDFSINAPVRPTDVTIDEGGRVELIAKVNLEVNGGNEPPAYDYNNRAYWIITDPADENYAAVAVNLTFPQVLLAGDTVRLGFAVQQVGLGVADGTMDMVPDLTMVVTYRGSVTLPE